MVGIQGSHISRASKQEREKGTARGHSRCRPFRSHLLRRKGRTDGRGANGRGLHAAAGCSWGCRGFALCTTGPTSLCKAVAKISILPPLAPTQCTAAPEGGKNGKFGSFLPSYAPLRDTFWPTFTQQGMMNALAPAPAPSLPEYQYSLPPLCNSVRKSETHFVSLHSCILS